MQLFLILGFVLSAFFQVDTLRTDTLHLRDAIEFAETNNPEIQQLEYAVEAQKQQQLLSLNIQNPRISFMDEGIGFGSFTEQRWTIYQQFDGPWKSYFRYSGAKKQTMALESRLLQTKLNMTAQIKQAYVDLLLANKVIDINTRQIELFEKIREIAELRVQSGVSTDMDLLQAKIQLMEAENGRLQAEQDQYRQLLALLNLLGVQEPAQYSDLVLTDSLNYRDINIDKTTLLAGISNSPAVNQALQAEEAARYLYKAAKSSYLPDFSVSYYRQNFGNNFDFYGFEVGITVPLWFGLNQAPNVKRAGAQLNQMEWRRYQLSQQVKAESQQAWKQFETAREVAMTYQNDILRNAEELVRKSQIGYEQGQFNLLTVLEAQRTYLRNSQMYYSSLSNYYQSIFQIEKILQRELVYD